MSAPLLLAAGAAALLLLGGKKKSKPAAAKAEEIPEDVPEGEGEDEVDEEIVEEDETPIIGEDEAVERGETVARGIRKDNMGHRGWRVRREADGFHAQIMTGISLHESVEEDLGVAATVYGAKKLLRDHFNTILLAKWKNAEPINEPSISEFDGGPKKYLATPSGGGGGGDPGIDFG